MVAFPSLRGSFFGRAGTRVAALMGAQGTGAALDGAQEALQHQEAAQLMVHMGPAAMVGGTLMGRLRVRMAGGAGEVQAKPVSLESSLSLLSKCFCFDLVKAGTLVSM